MSRPSRSSLPRRPRPGAAAAAVVVATLLGLLLGPAVGAQDPAEAPADPAAESPADDAASADPFDRLASCIGAEGRLLVVLLVDESASLRETDPDDQRVAAAQAALRSLDLLRGEAAEGSAGGAAVDIDVLVSTFSFDFAPVGEWSPLTDGSRGDIEDQIAGLADRDESMDTDFHNALVGARRALADRAAEAAESGSGGTCKAILLFTDGSYTLGPRTDEAQAERFGTTKEYAPGVVLDSEDAVREATSKGVTALCREGGVADQVRADRITLVSVPLGEGSGLLQALTTGQSDERRCGDPETDTPGAYLPASDTEELLRTFDLVASRIGGGTPVGDPSRPVPCADVCDEGSVTFAVSPSFRRVHVFAAVPDDGTRVVLQPPDGSALEVEVGADRQEDVAGVPVTARWIADRAVVLDLDVPADGTGAGDWQVALVGGDGGAPGLVEVVTFSGLVASFVQGTALELGAETALTATIATADGEAVGEELRDPHVTATLVDPITGTSETVELAAGADGFTGAYAVPDDVTAASLEATLRLEATTAEGAPLVSVAPEVSLVVRRPDGYPQVGSTTVELTPIVGDATAEGSMLLIAPQGQEAGCAWIEDLRVQEGPEDAGTFALTSEGLGRSADSCTSVEEPVEVRLAVVAEEPTSGSVVGHVRIVLARAGGGEPIATDVPVTFEMSRGVDEAKRLALAAGLMLGGLLAPLLLLLVINLITTRFPALGHVRAARIPVVVTPRGQILRSLDGGQGRTQLRLWPRDFAPLEASGRRRFTWGGLAFAARTSLNPLAEPYAVIAPAEGLADVSKEGRRTDLDLGLVGSWLFLLDQDASRAGAPGEVHGVVVAFASDVDVVGQTARLEGDVMERGPATARRLALMAGLPTTERMTADQLLSSSAPGR